MTECSRVAVVMSSALALVLAGCSVGEPTSATQGAVPPADAGKISGNELGPHSETAKPPEGTGSEEKPGLSGDMSVDNVPEEGTSNTKTNTSEMGNATEGMEAGMIAEKGAVAIARKAAEVGIDIPQDCPVTVDFKDGRYEVTFVHKLPRGVRGAGYYAIVTVDAHSGKVLKGRVSP